MKLLSRWIYVGPTSDRSQKRERERGGGGFQRRRGGGGWVGSLEKKKKKEKSRVCDCAASFNTSKAQAKSRVLVCTTRRGRRRRRSRRKKFDEKNGLERVSCRRLSKGAAFLPVPVCLSVCARCVRELGPQTKGCHHLTGDLQLARERERPNLLDA